MHGCWGICRAGQGLFWHQSTVVAIPLLGLCLSLFLAALISGDAAQGQGMLHREHQDTPSLVRICHLMCAAGHLHSSVFGPSPIPIPNFTKYGMSDSGMHVVQATPLRLQGPAQPREASEAAFELDAHVVAIYE